MPESGEIPVMGQRSMHLHSVKLQAHPYLFSRGKNRFKDDEDDGVKLLLSLNVEGVVVADDADETMRFGSFFN